MKGIWMLSAAALFVVVTGCSSKKQVSTLDGMGSGQAVTGAIEESGMMTEELDESLVGSSVREAEMGGASGAQSAGPADLVAARMGDIHFDFDQSVIRDQDKPILMGNAQELKANPNLKFAIEGHCDERGTTAYNLALGERRATATRRYLMALGVSPDQVTTVSYGEERPLCTDADEACWSQNRRAHVTAAR
ncbi:MAG: peptidoglycan-associated lipoprotein Pal [Nitrospirae bacterium]|nr:peptidoglycan-associated lipoprotein Pal [Nitrospirota bacterium]